MLSFQKEGYKSKLMWKVSTTTLYCKHYRKLYFDIFSDKDYLNLDYALAEIWFKGEASIEATRRLDWENMSLLKQLESYYYELIDVIRRKFTKQIQTQVLHNLANSVKNIN